MRKMCCLGGGYSGNNVIEFDGVITDDAADVYGINYSLITSQTFNLFGYPTLIGSFGYRSRSNSYSELELITDYQFITERQWFNIQTTRLTDNYTVDDVFFIKEDNRNNYWYMFGKLKVGDRVHCKITVNDITNSEQTTVTIINNTNRLQTFDYKIITPNGLIPVTLANNSQITLTSYVGAPLVGETYSTWCFESDQIYWQTPHIIEPNPVITIVS